MMPFPHVVQWLHHSSQSKSSWIGFALGTPRPIDDDLSVSVSLILNLVSHHDEFWVLRAAPLTDFTHWATPLSKLACGPAS